VVGFAHPTLKRGANNRCAYGAGDLRLLAQSTSTQASVRMSMRGNKPAFSTPARKTSLHATLWGQQSWSRQFCRRMLIFPGELNHVSPWTPPEIADLNSKNEEIHSGRLIRNSIAFASADVKTTIYGGVRRVLANRLD